MTSNWIALCVILIFKDSFMIFTKNYKYKILKIFNLIYKNNIELNPDDYTDLFNNGLFYTYYCLYKNEVDFSEKDKKSYNFQIAKNIYYLKKFRYLNELCLKNDVRIVPIKGIALLLKYDDLVNIRPLNDIDIFVEEKYLEKLKDILINDGFCSDHKYPEIFSYKNLKIDIHSRLININRIPIRKKLSVLEVDPSDFFEKENLFLFTDEFHFIYLCCHLAIHHGFNRLIWLYDLIYLLNQPDFNFELLNNLIDRTNTHKIMDITFSLLKRLRLIDYNYFDKISYNDININLKFYFDYKDKTLFKYYFTFYFFNNIYDKIRYALQLIIPDKQLLKDFYFPKTNENNLLKLYYTHIKSVLKLCQS